PVCHQPLLACGLSCRRQELCRRLLLAKPEGCTGVLAQQQPQGCGPNLGGEERRVCRLEVQEGEGGVPRPQVRGPGGGDAGEGGAGEGVRGPRNGACGCPQLLDG